MMHANGISYEGTFGSGLGPEIDRAFGAWFRYGDMQLGQGREKTRTYMIENPALVEELKNKIMASAPSWPLPRSPVRMRRISPADSEE